MSHITFGTRSKVQLIAEASKGKKPASIVVITTTTHEITERIWKILRCMDPIWETGAFNIDRRSNTQFEFTANGGYTINQVFNVVLAGVYLSTINRPIGEFLRESLNQHLANIKDRTPVNYEGCELDESALSFVIMEWAREKASIAAKRFYNDHVNGGGADMTHVTNERVKAAREAHQRLLFTKPEDRGITAAEKQTNLVTIRTSVELLEDNASLMRRTATSSRAIKEKALASVGNFINSLPAATLGQISIDFLALQEMLIDCSEQLNLLAEEFGSLAYGSDILRVALECAPQEKKNK